MSFQAQFQQYDKQNKQLFDGYIKRTTQLPLQLQQLIQGNEKKLSLFIQNFQSQIVTLKKSQQRDSKLINNLNQENNQRRYQTILIQSATKMQENIVQKLKNNLNTMNFTVKNIEQRIHKHQQNMNRYQIDFQNIQNKSKNKANSGIVQIDREGGKLLIKIDKNGHKNYEVLYNKKEDKFSGNFGDKQIAQAIIQFNFHRDLNKLCADLYQNS